MRFRPDGGDHIGSAGSIVIKFCSSITTAKSAYVDTLKDTSTIWTIGSGTTVHKWTSNVRTSL